MSGRWLQNGTPENSITSVLSGANGTFENLISQGYCYSDTSQTSTLPGQSSNNQIQLLASPYGPPNCNQFATLIKPGINPLTLRGITNSNVIVFEPVNDTGSVSNPGGVCFPESSCVGPVCIDNSVAVGGSCSDQYSPLCMPNANGTNNCSNMAPGGLADWMGQPTYFGDRTDMPWSTSVKNQISNKNTGANAYTPPIQLLVPDLMKYGFVTQGCECQSATSRITGQIYESSPGIYNLTTDAGVSSEVWNGEGTCDTYLNTAGTSIIDSTCVKTIQKYAATCEWCSTASLQVTNLPELCSFSEDNNGNLTDNGDCFGFGINGKPRISCNPPQVNNCPITTPATQMIGLNCNIPAGNRLTGLASAISWIQDIYYVTIATGSAQNQYTITYQNGIFGISVSNYNVTITFPNATTAQNLLNSLQNSSLNSIFYTSLSPQSGHSSTSPQNATGVYNFIQGSDAITNLPQAVAYPGNCAVKLDGTIWTTSEGPISGQPWLGMTGLACNIPLNNGKCSTDLLTNPEYSPSASGDCQICTSDLWNWIPGGYSSVMNTEDPLYWIANLAYIPKFQATQGNSTFTGNKETFGNPDGTPDDDTSCDQTPISDPALSPSGSTSSTKNSVPYCNNSSSPNNSCTDLCTQCGVMSWGSGIPFKSTPIDALSGSSGFTIVQSQASSGSINGSLPLESCSNGSDLLCERNPALTLRGTSADENGQLVSNWLNGVFNIDTIHGFSTQLGPNGGPLGDIPDPRATQAELQNRTIKAMRCCLGLDPGFVSIDGNNGSPKLVPNSDPYGGNEIWFQSECPPGTVCPSSDTCKELFKSVMSGTNSNITMNLNDFGSASYPTTYTLTGLNGTLPNPPTNTTPAVSSVVDMMNPAYYAKAYCEMMSGASKANTGTGAMGFDDEINTLCRKTMYTYCASPVEVSLINTGNYWSNLTPLVGNNPNISDYFRSSYRLPLNIFSESCYAWFGGGSNNLDEVMPSDYGTRDMLLGAACQRLQVDGWYNPVNPAGSPLLTSFVSSGGQITDTTGRVLDLSHTGKISSSSTDSMTGIPGLLANTCSCFLQGSTCTGNCSYQYCSAGVNNQNGPGQINIDFGTKSTSTKSTNSNAIDLTPYTNISGGDGSWTKWNDRGAPAPGSPGINTSNFTCANGSPLPGTTFSGNNEGGACGSPSNPTPCASSCFRDCNYVNEYDVCWNAGPINRKYSATMLGLSPVWNCNDSTTEGFQSNSCDAYSGYSCMGECDINKIDSKGNLIPNCGTIMWFDTPLGLNPGEIAKKQNQPSIPTQANITNYPYWQNYYSNVNTNVLSATIPGGFGTISDQSGATSIASDTNYCSSPNSIKPYNLSINQPTGCTITQTTSFNNQGIIGGNIGISNIATCDTSDSIFKNPEAKISFLTYMGANNCSGVGSTTDCWNTDPFCINDGSNTGSTVIPGDNCMYCGPTPSNLQTQNPLAYKAMVSAPNKPLTCCLDPSVNTNANYLTANTNIQTALQSNVISYFCGPIDSTNTCPIGSTDLTELEATCGTNFVCSSATDQTTCGSCKFCQWFPSQTDTTSQSGICTAVCPIAPTSGWTGTDVTTLPPTNGPTVGPTVRPTVGPSGPSGSITSLPTSIIVLIVIGIILGICLIANSVIVSKSKQSGKLPSSFGKIKKLITLK